MSRSRTRKSSRQPIAGARPIQATPSLATPSDAAEPHPGIDQPTHQLPRVSICTLTHNRGVFLPLLQACVARQTYPHELLEWVIVDDSDNGEPPFTADQELDIKVKHISLPSKLILGKKRNTSHDHCEGEIIVYMDDDDYYPPQRVSHAVDRLLETDCLVAGGTILPIYFTDTGQAWVAGPYGKNHATANTFAFRRELLKQTRYDDASTHAEEKAFLKNYQIPMAQLDPTQTILCMGHSRNTFDKRKLIQAGKNPRMRKLSDLPDKFIPPQALDAYAACHANSREAQLSPPRGLLNGKTTITLDLGCGVNPRNPFQAHRVCGVDLSPISPKAAEVRSADLAIEPIPWDDEHFDYITAYDFLQHIPRIVYCPNRRLSFVELMNETWRCLKIGGLLLSSTPAYPHPEAFQDPTHVNIITEKTFAYYFAGPCWARMYGFRGLFEIKSQNWDGYALKTIMVKRAVP